MRQRSSSHRWWWSRNERASCHWSGWKVHNTFCGSVHNTGKVFSSWFLFIFCSSSMSRTFINISGSLIYMADAEYTIKNCSTDWRTEFYPLFQHFLAFKSLSSKIFYSVSWFLSLSKFYQCIPFSPFSLLNFFLSSGRSVIEDQYTVANTFALTLKK